MPAIPYDVSVRGGLAEVDEHARGEDGVGDDFDLGEGPFEFLELFRGGVSRVKSVSGARGVGESGGERRGEGRDTYVGYVDGDVENCEDCAWGVSASDREAVDWATYSTLAPYMTPHLCRRRSSTTL